MGWNLLTRCHRIFCRRDRGYSVAKKYQRQNVLARIFCHFQDNSVASAENDLWVAKPIEYTNFTLLHAHFSCLYSCLASYNYTISLVQFSFASVAWWFCSIFFWSRSWLGDLGMTLRWTHLTNNDYWLLPRKNLELQTLHALASYCGSDEWQR